MAEKDKWKRKQERKVKLCQGRLSHSTSTRFSGRDHTENSEEVRYERKKIVSRDLTELLKDQFSEPGT